MARSLLLSDEWDICLDLNGGIAMTDGEGGEAYAIAQNVANAVRLFTEDAYFDTDRGIPHFDVSLGRSPMSTLAACYIRKAAMGVDGVESADVSLDPLDTDTRTLSGEITLTLTNGETANVSI